MTKPEFVGRLRQFRILSEFAEWSRGDASDIEGQPIWARERARTSQTPYNYSGFVIAIIARAAWLLLSLAVA
jgi:hypothetical protein